MQNLRIELTQSNELVFYDKDNSKVFLNNPNSTIYSWTLKIYGATLSKTFTFDILEYIQNRCIDMELLTLLPTQLGFLTDFKDGIYYTQSLINNVYSVEDSFLLLPNIDKQFEDIASKTTAFETTDVFKQTYNLLTTNITDNINKALLIRNEIVILASKNQYQIINDKLDILKRLLTSILNFFVNDTVSNNK